MAEKSGSGPSKQELRRRAAASREALGRDLGGMGYELDFPLKVKKSFQRNTVYWVGGALAVGLCVALLRARTRKIYISAAGKKVHGFKGEKNLLNAGLLVSAIKLAGPLLQPIVAGYFAKKGSKKGAQQGAARR